MSDSIRYIELDGVSNPIQSFSHIVDIKKQNECIPLAGTSKVYQVSDCSCGTSEGYILATSWNSGTYVTQLFMAANGTKLVYIRYYNGSSWTDWSKIMSNSDTYTKTEFNNLINENIGAPGDDGLKYWVQSNVFDLTATKYNTNTYYPVYGGYVGSNGATKLKVVARLEDSGTPSWCTSQDGFKCNFEIQDQKSGWGTTDAQTIILINECVNTNNVSPVSYDQMTEGSVPVIYLRGGGKYHVYSTYSVTWTILETGEYKRYNQTIKPLTYRPDPRGDTYKGDNGDPGPSVISSSTATDPNFSNGGILKKNGSKVSYYTKSSTHTNSASSIPTSSLINTMNTTLNGKLDRSQIDTLEGIAYVDSNECNLSRGYSGGKMYINYRGCTGAISKYFMCNGNRDYGEASVHADDFQASDGSSLKSVCKNAFKASVDSNNRLTFGSVK